jgi:hypothetical protein
VVAAGLAVPWSRPPLTRTGKPGQAGSHLLAAAAGVRGLAHGRQHSQQLGSAADGPRMLMLHAGLFVSPSCACLLLPALVRQSLEAAETSSTHRGTSMPGSPRANPIAVGLHVSRGALAKGVSTPSATCPTHRGGHVAGCSLPSRLRQWVPLEE